MDKASILEQAYTYTKLLQQQIQMIRSGFSNDQGYEDIMFNSPYLYLQPLELPTNPENLHGLSPMPVVSSGMTMNDFRM